MIVIKTKLKKIPEKCNKCNYSYTDGGFGLDSQRFCSVCMQKGLNRACPMEYNKEKRNWEYFRPDWCPIEELKNQ